MLDAEDIVRQRELLALHRQTLHHYLRQQASLGNAYTPPAVTSGISEARAEIKQIKDILRTHAAVVDDQPQDDAIVGEAPLDAPARPVYKQMRPMLLMSVGAIIIALLLWRVALPFMQSSPTQASGSGGQFTTSTANIAATAIASRQFAVALPEGDTVTILYLDSKVTYKVMHAEVQPLSPGQSLLSLTIRASTTYPPGINFWARNINLRLKNETRRSTTDPDKTVVPNETKDAVFEFPIPSEPTQAHIVFTIGKSPVELLLDVK